MGTTAFTRATRIKNHTTSIGNGTNIMSKTILLIVSGILSICVFGIVVGDSDRFERDGHRGWIESRPDVAPVDNTTYSEECGACHFVYQPGLLPAAAWQEIMGSLAEHYGDDASLDDETAKVLAAYLQENAADKASRSRSRAFSMMPRIGNGPPRISQAAYFVREHDEIPDRLVKDNPEVGSFSACSACHTKAEAGIYNEHEVVIPGFGRWDD